ncbi:MAG: hypothetical protein WC455_13385 [Dehalococcoidia bacterium]
MDMILCAVSSYFKGIEDSELIKNDPYIEDEIQREPVAMPQLEPKVEYPSSCADCEPPGDGYNKCPKDCHNLPQPEPEFKVGDYVWCADGQDGNIAEIDPNGSHPYRVGQCWYRKIHINLPPKQKPVAQPTLGEEIIPLICSMNCSAKLQGADCPCEQMKLIAKDVCAAFRRVVEGIDRFKGIVPNNPYDLEHTRAVEEIKAYLLKQLGGGK